MKKKYIYSGIIGSAFFGVSYLALSLGIIPSLITSVVSFGASSLIFKDDYSLDELGYKNQEEYRKLLENSKKDLLSLKSLRQNITDEKVLNNVSDIIKITDKIIKLLYKKPDKVSSATKFLNYYLPITIKILERYEEINNQQLTSKSSMEFSDRIRNLIVNIEIAFENQLNNLYNDDLIDINAEMRVFETMLETDGLLNNDTIKVKDGDRNE